MENFVLHLDAQQCNVVSRGLASRILLALENLKHPKCDEAFWREQIALCDELRARLPPPLPRKAKVRA